MQGVKRAAEPLHGDYTSSALPDQRGLIDTHFNLQGTRGEVRWGRVEIVTGSVSFILVATEQFKVFVEKGQAAWTNDRLLRPPLCPCAGKR